MAAFRKGDIVIFPFPYTDLKNRKIRPCLVISEEMREDLILCQLTSQKTKKDNFSIELNKSDTENGSLFIDSYVRSNMLFTANKSQIIKKICEINAKRYEEVILKIKEIITK
ncbi:type II toxin-antitoxin system PemK/MazF family toxin [Candidatus Woesearchaeota archaeon]|nr:type II toxin-antitoxin system PemK/MazF family toxin [Candidatus Woesearchaeota archaeon]